jgi:hypothetical protein
LGEDDVVGGVDGFGDSCAGGCEVEGGIGAKLVYLAAGEGGDIFTSVSR